MSTQPEPPDTAVDVAALAALVEQPDEGARALAHELQAQLAKPTGALGRLEDLSVWLAGVQGISPPLPLSRVRVVIFAGDHGVASEGVSAYPPAITRMMLGAFLGGGAAVSILAAEVGAGVRVLDLGVDADSDDLPAEVTRFKVRRGSGRIDVEDALTLDEARAAFAAGRQVADEEVDGGADLLIPGDMGIGNTTIAAALVGALVGTDAAAVVGRGTGIDDRAWMRKTEIVRDALRRGRPLTGDPIALLAAIGSADTAAMTGFLLQAAIRRTPVVLDGVVSCACAAVAYAIAPRASLWWVAGHRSTEPSQALALRHLSLSPLVDLGLRLGEGTGALLAVPLLRAAQATLAEMATLADLGVGDAG